MVVVCGKSATIARVVTAIERKVDNVGRSKIKCSLSRRATHQLRKSVSTM